MISNKISKIEVTTLKKYGIFLVLILMFVIASILSPYFFTQTNLINVIRQVVVISLIACGATMVMISGMIDLSAGSVVALAGVIAVDIMAKTGSVFLAVLAGIIVGILAESINGVLIAKFDLPPFIATLAMMLSARGAVLLYTNAMPISNLGKLTFLGQGYIGIIPVPIIILVIFATVAAIILKCTKFGRHMYALGSNQLVARNAGINIKRLKISVFMLNGMFVGIAGVVLMARMNSGQPVAGIGFEFEAITAVIIGGTSLSGGIGAIEGTLAGALIMGILSNIFNLLNISIYLQQISKGIIVVFAVIMDLQTKKSYKHLK
jgi:inositol transport system permease protein